MGAETDTLYVVVLDVKDSSRRRRARRILASFGQGVNANVFEIPGTQRLLGVVTAALGPELREEDEVRVYPVCAKCRERVVLWGDAAELACRPVALFL